MRRLPQGVPAERRPARPLLRARAPGRRDRPHELRPEQRILRGPDREEAPEPFLPGLVRPLVRHGRLQPGLPVLPELGHLEVPSSRHARGFRIPRAHRRLRRVARLPERRLHLQRSRRLHGIRDRRGRGVPRTGHQVRRRDRGLHVAGAACRDVQVHGRRQRRPQGVHGGLLPEGLRGAPRAGSRDARVPREGDERLDRDHDPPHPGPQRLGPGDRRHDALDRGPPRPGRPSPLHRVSSGLEDARPARDAPRHAPARARDRTHERVALGLHGKRIRPRGTDHGLPGCGKTLIGRDGYEILDWGLGADGRCLACGAKCPGTFEESPGTWGARRRPVMLKTR